MMPANAIPDTHNEAAQASAGRLVLQLRKDLSLPNGEPADGVKDCLDYLDDCKTKLLQGGDCPVYSHAALCGISHLVRHLFTRMAYRSVEDKLQVLEEIERQIWLGQDHWTRNAVFIDGEAQVIDVSLGEALHLVTMVLCGDKLEGSEQERDLRIDTLFNTLLKLRKDNKCTGGRQHDVLYVLNGVYQIKTADGRSEYWLMIEDTQEFLIQTLQQYVVNRFTGRFKPDDIVHWVASEVDTRVEMPASIASVLDEIQADAAVYLKARAAQFGLNLSDAVVGDVVGAIQSIPVPEGLLREGLVPLLRGFYALKKTGQISERDDGIDSLKGRLNMLNIIKLERFMEAEAYFQHCLSYQSLSLSFNEGDAAFINARDALMKALSVRYNELLNLDLDTDFERIKKEFLKAEKQFKSSHPVESITNFFALFANEPEHRAVLLAQLQTHKAAFQSDLSVRLR